MNDEQWYQTLPEVQHHTQGTDQKPASQLKIRKPISLKPSILFDNRYKSEFKSFDTVLKKKLA